MSNVLVNIALSLDGYMAPERMTIEHGSTPEYKHWGAKWGALMARLIDQQYFRENLKLGSGGETGPVNDLIRGTTELTHEKRQPWVRPGGTTIYFINDEPQRALELARESVGSRDVRIAGGANVIQQYLSGGCASVKAA